MVGKFDREAGQNINRRALGTGFVSAMLGLGVICRGDSLSSAASKNIRKQEMLILGHTRPGKRSSNSSSNCPHRARSKAHMPQTDSPNFTKELQPH